MLATVFLPTPNETQQGLLQREDNRIQRGSSFSPAQLAEVIVEDWMSG